MPYRMPCVACSFGIAVELDDAGAMTVCPNCKKSQFISATRMVESAVPVVATATPVPLAPSTLPDAPVKSRRGAILAASVVLLGGAVGGYFALPPREQPEPQRESIDPQFVAVAQTPPTDRPTEVARFVPQLTKVVIVSETEETPRPDRLPVAIKDTIPDESTPPKAADPEPEVPKVVIAEEVEESPKAAPAPPKAKPTPPVAVVELRPIRPSAKRIDMRSSEELRKELARFPEVNLDTVSFPLASAGLANVAATLRARGLPYPGPAVIARARPDLSGLPFILGPDSQLGLEPARQMHALSRELRVAVESCTPRGATDPRPDPDQLFDRLVADSSGKFRGNAWKSPTGVPCVEQMLQPEGEDVRLMSVELLRRVPDARATKALADWAVFDISADVRKACVKALADRDRSEYAPALMDAFRFPWPRAAEHAAEALVALNDRDSIAPLIDVLDRPEPDQIFEVQRGDRMFPLRREVVRTNHLANCVMCHAPSADKSDLVRGAVPVPGKAIPAAATTPAYYESDTGTFVRADITYLRQDFSVVQSVPTPGEWPSHQRYDYFVRVRSTPERAAPTTESGEYHAAARFALRELTGKDGSETATSWREATGIVKTPHKEPTDKHVDQFLKLATNPTAALALAWHEFGQRFVALLPREQDAMVFALRREFGNAFVRELVDSQVVPLQTGENVAMREQAKASIDRIRRSTPGLLTPVPMTE